ncbi:response regulator transcription factor [Paenibacillus flagellatus]|uniref:DNA-binding response regulator n=1 Tax=Paenibacillus flagellatus TaxID=2211139 RepID=A0A2V5KER8_9BACL|nr:response regulator transcription factor [Paenibacillus flagellatus]PYI52490.1 DNA-binding response regulator [Paenibacillus flagellatus]
MQPIQVLIADDDKEIRDLVKAYLEKEQYKADTAADGEEALRLFDTKTYHLVLLDLMMPKIDGIEVCRALRAKSNVPIVMLTAKDTEIDKVVGLSVGADDYMTKPFGIHELVARIKAHTRRYFLLGGDGGAQQETALRFKGISIDPKTHTVTKAGEPVHLTAKEFELLHFLASHPNQVFTKTQIFRQVWDSDYIEDDNTVMVHIRKLRLKIETDPSDPKRIQTVWGIGYRFAGEKDE